MIDEIDFHWLWIIWFDHIWSIDLSILTAVFYLKKIKWNYVWQFIDALKYRRQNETIELEAK